MQRMILKLRSDLRRSSKVKPRSWEEQPCHTFLAPVSVESFDETLAVLK